MHVAPAKAKHDRQTERQTDDEQSDSYVALTFAGATKMLATACFPTVC